MARVERVTVAEPVPVERAQLVSPSEFRFSMASAETLEQIGGVLSELGRRKIEMQDRIGISNINAAMENAEREYQLEIIAKPLEEHAAILQKHRNNAIVFAGPQRLSPGAKSLADNKLQIWGDIFADVGEIATIKAIERDALIRVTADLQKALTEGGPEDIVEAEAAFDAQAKTSYTPAEAKVEKEKIEQRAIKQMEENAISNVHAAIEVASDPETGTGNFDIARDLAKNELIPESKQTTLRNTINSAEKAVGTIKRTQLKELQEQTAIDFSGRIAQVENAADAVSIMTDIDKAIANETLDRKAGEGYKRELVKGSEVPTNWKTYNQLVLDIEAVRDGDKDFLEVFNEIQTHRGKDLNGSEIDALTASSRTAKSIAQGDLPSVTANSLTRFQRILTAYYNAGMWGDISDEDELPEAAAKYADKAAQLDKFFAEQKPTFKESEDFFKQLTEDAEKDGLFERLWKKLGTIEPTLLGFQIALDAQKNKLKNLGDQNRLKLDSRNVGDIENVNGENWILIKRGETPAEDVWQKQ